MSNFGNMIQGIFSNDNFKNLLPSHSRNVNVMYQTKEIINKLSWTNDFLPVIIYFNNSEIRIHFHYGIKQTSTNFVNFFP